jgi:hypothetical protein
MRRVGFVALAVVAVVAARCWVLPRLIPPGSIEYRGHTIRLSKYYFEYDDYDDRVCDLLRLAR